MSVRTRLERQERLELEAQLDAKVRPASKLPEVSIRPSGFTSENNGAVMRVRDRMTIAAEQKQEAAPQPVQNNRVDWEAFEKRQAAIQAGSQRDEQAAIARRKAENDARLQSRLADITFSGMCASARERELVLSEEFEGQVQR